MNKIKQYFFYKDGEFSWWKSIQNTLSNRNIGNIIFFLLISIINFLILYVLVNNTPNWEKYSVQFTRFIYFLVISFFIVLASYWYISHKFLKDYIVKLSYSTLFCTLVFLLIPSVCWFLQYDIESNVYGIGRKLAFSCMIASFSLYFNTALIGLGNALFSTPKIIEINFKLKCSFFLLCSFHCLSWVIFIFLIFFLSLKRK